MPPPARASLRRRAMLIGSAGALCAGQCVGAAPGPASRRVFGDMVGLGVKFSQGQPVRDLAMLVDLKVRWVRDAIRWPDLEPAAGRFVDFSPALQQQLDFYRRHGIGLIAMLTLGNSLAYSPSPGAPARQHDPQAFGRFAAQVARMLRAAGVRFVIEIGNEPHNSAFAKTLGGAWNGRAPSPWVDHYVSMVREAVGQVKGVDPTVKLLSDDDMWVIHYWFLEAGLPGALDGFAIHPYTPGVPERTAVAHDTEWTRPFTVVDPDRSLGSAVRRLRDQGRSKLDREPEIWITEWGWPVGDGRAQGSIPDQLLVAYLPRAFILSAAAGVEVLCWFSAQDSVDGPMGLKRNDGVTRDSYQAFKTLTTELGDRWLLRHAAGMRAPTLGLQAFLFQGPQSRTLVAWSVDGRSMQLPWPVSDRPLRAVDALGRELPPPSAATPYVTVGAAPVYLQTNRSDADLDADLAAVA